MGNSNTLEDRWIDALADQVFMGALAKYLAAADLHEVLRDKQRLADFHALAQVSYQAGFIRGQQAQAAVERRSERPTLRPLEPDESAYLASCPDDDEALKARRRECAEYDDQTALWDILYPQSKPVAEQPSTELASEVPVPGPLPTVLVCSVCGEPQRATPAGPVCANGHGGAEGVDPSRRIEIIRGSNLSMQTGR